MKYIIALFMPLLIGCFSDSPPTKSELVGKWKGSDCTYLILEENGTFTAKGLSKETATSFSISSANSVFSGSGNWKIQMGQGFWEVRLDFKEINRDFHNNGFYTLLVSGNNKLENKSPWYLFVWADEEGGPRNKLIKD